MQNGISTDQDLTSLAASLKSYGIGFAFRYYSRTTHISTKRLTQQEALALSAAGLQIGVVYEDAPTSVAYFSTARGQQDAAAASAEALSLKQPPNSAIYFAVDYDAALADISGPILDYFNGVHQAMQMGPQNGAYKIGVYGSGNVCGFLKAKCSFVSYTWLAEATAWGGTKTYSGWHVKQTAPASTLCGLTPDAYESNLAPADFGAFTLIQAAHTTAS